MLVLPSDGLLEVTKKLYFSNLASIIVLEDLIASEKLTHYLLKSFVNVITFFNISNFGKIQLVDI